MGYGTTTMLDAPRRRDLTSYQDLFLIGLLEGGPDKPRCTQGTDGDGGLPLEKACLYHLSPLLEDRRSAEEYRKIPSRAFPRPGRQRCFGITI
jgi:hypothetical protein